MWKMGLTADIGLVVPSPNRVHISLHKQSAFIPYVEKRALLSQSKSRSNRDYLCLFYLLVFFSWLRLKIPHSPRQTQVRDKREAAHAHFKVKKCNSLNNKRITKHTTAHFILVSLAAVFWMSRNA